MLYLLNEINAREMNIYFLHEFIKWN